MHAYQPKFHLKKSSYTKFALISSFFLRPSTLISQTISMYVLYILIVYILYHSYTLNVTLTAKIKMSLWNTDINNYFLTKCLMSTNNHYNFNLVMQL